MPTLKLQETLSASKKWLLSVEPAEPDLKFLQRAKEQLVQQPAVRDLMSGRKTRLLNFKVTEDAETAKSQTPSFNSFEAIVYDYSDNSSSIISGRLDFSAPLKIRKTFIQMVYSAEEINHAREIASANPAIKKLLDTQKAVLLPSMPAAEFKSQTHAISDRIVSLLVQPVNPGEKVQIIGVNLNQDQLIRPVVSIESRPELINHSIHPITFRWPLLLQETNSNKQVWFTVKDASTNTELWKMLVVRPTASTGPAGSGLEIKYVNYKGKRVLFKMHAPIWNVLYKGTPVEYRDWTNVEAGFNATGTPFKDTAGNNLNNFLLCSAPPTTIFETGADGAFHGVAFFENPDGSWTLSTMMQAGWYRYYMGYTFFADGTIKPRLGFTTDGSNPFAGFVHIHHAYFRFDFDMGNINKNVIQQNSIKISFQPTPPFTVTNQVHTLISHEQKLFRKPFTTSYSILEKGTSRGYQITKGPDDGTASGDTYAKGDIWALDYDAAEQYDNPPSGVTSVELDKFVNNESLDGADVVLWYGVHFTHDPGHTHGEKDFGPSLHPLNW